jgi:hypothetical protein
MHKLLEISFGRKRIERITERIGAERLQQADQEVADFQKRTLMEKVEGPVGVPAPSAAAVMLDGGRYQRQEQNPDATSEKSTHWFEYKAGLCLKLGGRPDGVERGPEASDPCPEVPEFLLNLDYVDKLTREIGQKAKTDESVDRGGAPAAPDSVGPVGPDETEAPIDIDLDAVQSLADLESQLAAVNAEVSSPRGAKRIPLSPRVESRDVVATLEKGQHIGRQLVARAWKLGMFQATYKAFVGDGSGWIWTIFAKFFKPFGFTPILDIIHAVTYVYAAAMAGRTRREGAAVYRRWIHWLWQSELSKLIAALASRQAELGLPSPEESDTSPRQIVSKTLTYLQNQQGKMRYPEYRKLGLPITSSHMESAIKELNYRIKGTEKFWGEGGGAAVLQMKSDTISASDHLADFWRTRSRTCTGFHNSVGHRKPAKQAAG